MKKAVIANKNYKTILWILLFFTIVGRGLGLFMKFDLGSILPILFGVVVVVFMLTENPHLRTAVKIMAGLTILGAGLQLFALFIKISGGFQEGPIIFPVIDMLILLAVSLYLFLGSDKHIQIEEE